MLSFTRRCCTVLTIDGVSLTASVSGRTGGAGRGGGARAVRFGAQFATTSVLVVFAGRRGKPAGRRRCCGAPDAAAAAAPVLPAAALPPTAPAGRVPAAAASLQLSRRSFPRRLTATTLSQRNRATAATPRLRHCGVYLMVAYSYTHFQLWSHGWQKGTNTQWRRNIFLCRHKPSCVPDIDADHTTQNKIALKLFDIKERKRNTTHIGVAPDNASRGRRRGVT